MLPRVNSNAISFENFQKQFRVGSNLAHYILPSVIPAGTGLLSKKHQLCLLNEELETMAGLSAEKSTHFTGIFLFENSFLDISCCNWEFCSKAFH